MNLDEDDEIQSNSAQSRQHSALRSELSAALTAFDRAQDWADLIHDLQRVNRVLSKHSNTSFLPDKHVVAKRLAQCLTSFLPSGVHLKALETYHIVFKRIGQERLSADLPIYSGGLFPLLSYCSTSLKGPLLSLYESHLLPLGPALAPILDGLVLAILPGLEDETSEFYVRARTLLDKVATAVADVGVFSRAIWRALLLSQPVRYAASHYLRLKLAPNLDLEADTSKVVSATGSSNITTVSTVEEDVLNHAKLRSQMVVDMPLVAYAVTAALSDTESLIQRNVLDLLLGEVALDAPFFCSSSVAKNDVRSMRKLQQKSDAAIALVGGVFVTLLKRDMSLTKRVHTWLLGGKDGEAAMQFCLKYSKHLILAAIDKQIEECLSQKQQQHQEHSSFHKQQQLRTPTGKDVKALNSSTRPCRIAIALIDRPELCDCIGRDIARRMLDFGRRAVSAEHIFAAEISNAVADVLQDVGSARVFADLEQVLTKGKEQEEGKNVKSNEKTYENFELLAFSLSMLPTKDAVVRTKHLPALLQVVVDALDDVYVSNELRVLDKAVGFCSKAVLAMRVSHGDPPLNNEDAETMGKTVAAFGSFFVAWLAQTVQTAPPHLRRDYTTIEVADEVSAEVEVATVSESHEEIISIAKNACALFVAASAAINVDAEIISIALHAAAKCACSADIRVSLAGARAFADVSSRADSVWTTRIHLDYTNLSITDRNIEKQSDSHQKKRHNNGDRDISSLEEQVYGVIRRCWRQMHPSLRTATAQSAQTLLALQSRYPEHVRVVLADGMLSPILSRRVRNLERFACLWRLAVEHRLLPLPADSALFLMLDALTDEHWGTKMLARSWLADALEVDAATVIDAPLRLLLTSEARSVGPRHEFTAVYDAPRSLYALHTLRSILESSPSVLGSSLSEQPKVNLPPSAQLARHHKKTYHRGRVGIRALASASPSPRTVQAMSTVFAIGNSHHSENEFLFNDGSGPGSVPSKPLSSRREQGPVQLAHLLPAHNYIVVIGLTCLGYLRGRVPQRFRSRSDVNSETKQTDNQESIYSEDDEDLEWTLAGLGLKSMVELHEGVSAAAAECLATLLVATPAPSQMSSVLANLFAQPVLNLISSGILGTAGSGSDPVLQLHSLNAMSFLISADGPCYMSSVHGNQVFSKAHHVSNLSTISLSESHSQGQLLQARGAVSVTGSGAGAGASSFSVDNISGSDAMNRRDANCGTTESLDLFIPWLFSGVTLAALADRDSGSHEILGVRRQWIQLIDTVMKHIGFTLPVVIDGLLIIFCQLLEKRQRDVAEVAAIVPALSDNEFSRVDETLVLLEGLAVVTSNTLWSFEHALATGDLKDGAALPSSAASKTGSSGLHRTIAGGGTGNSSNQGSGGTVEHSSSDPSTHSTSRDSATASAKGGISSFLMSASNVVSGTRTSGVPTSNGTEMPFSSNSSKHDPHHMTQAQNMTMQTSTSEGLSSSPHVSASSSLVDKASVSVTNTTSSMINALNPLRMINDFVKDVWIGSAVDGTHRALDPRRSGARILFCLLPVIMQHITRVWGPPSEVQVDSGAVVQGETIGDDYGVGSAIGPSVGGHSFSRSSIGSGSGASGAASFSGGPIENHSVATSSGRDRATPLAGLPRLSTELPKERRQAQRSLVLSILEPLFEIRPLDVVAAVISIFYHEQDEFGVLPSRRTSDDAGVEGNMNYAKNSNRKKKSGPSISRMACHMLHALGLASVDIVAHCVKIIFEKAVKWDAGIAEATEGRAQASLRQHAQSAISALIGESVASVGRSTDSSPATAMRFDLTSVGKTALNDQNSALPGGTTGVNLAHFSASGLSGGGSGVGIGGLGIGLGSGNGGGGSGSARLLSSSSAILAGGTGLDGVHQEMFYWGDFFAGHSAAVVETACINFVDEYIATSDGNGGEGVTTAWNHLFPMLRDGLLGVRRKASIPAMVRALGTFVSASLSPTSTVLSDRRVKREVLLVAMLTISACNPIAGGSSDIGVEEHGNAPLFKKRLAVVALDSLGSSAPLLLDAAFVDDRQQLGTTVSACVGPAVTTLKKAAARAAAIAHADTSASANVAGARNANSESDSSAGGAEGENHHGQTTLRRKKMRLPGSQDDESIVDLQASAVSARVLLGIGRRDWGIKLIRGKVLSLLEDANWFHGKSEGVLRLLSQVVRDVVANGGGSALLSALGTWPSGSGTPAMNIPGLFIGRDSETALRARSIRRIAYVIFVSDPELYAGQMSLVLERVRDVLRTSEMTLVSQCIFCMRALLLRTGPSSITAFRATVLAETFRILGAPEKDLKVTMGVLRLLDVVTLLGPAEYGYERGLLFGQDDVLEAMGMVNRDGGDDGVEVENGEKQKKFVPLVMRVATRLWKEVREWTMEEIFQAPLQLRQGQLVVGGAEVRDAEADNALVGRYAAGLVVRSAMPMMKASEADHDAICNEYEHEFVYQN